eukprot:1151117-Pelagomonas_calceolata.AAC.4
MHLAATNYCGQVGDTPNPAPTSLSNMAMKKRQDQGSHRPKRRCPIGKCECFSGGLNDGSHACPLAQGQRHPNPHPCSLTALQDPTAHWLH